MSETPLPSSIAIPREILELWVELETKVRESFTSFNYVLMFLDDTRQRLEDAAVQQRAASDRLGSEAIARLLAEPQQPTVIACLAAVEGAARQLIDQWNSPDGMISDTMKLLERQLKTLDEARAHAATGPKPA